MKKYIGEYDKTEAFLALIEILEIKGKNKMIGDLQEDVIRTFKETYKDASFNIDWVISMTLKARKNAIEDTTLNGD